MNDQFFGLLADDKRVHIAITDELQPMCQEQGKYTAFSILAADVPELPFCNDCGAALTVLRHEADKAWRQAGQLAARVLPGRASRCGFIRLATGQECQAPAGHVSSSSAREHGPWDFEADDAAP